MDKTWEIKKTLQRVGLYRVWLQYRNENKRSRLWGFYKS
jgi:hypothetical protein